MKLLLFILSVVPLFSYAGVMNGGGGVGVKCTTNNSIKLEVLDIFEANNVARLTPLPTTGDLKRELALGMNGLERVWAEPEDVRNPNKIDSVELDKVLKTEFYDKLVYIPAGTRLSLTKDATIPVLPLGCEPVQIAIYSGLGIEVDKEYWDMLDARNQAALILHEILYSYRRDYGATDSDETRKFVGRIFSTTPPEQRFGDAPATGYLDCTASGDHAPTFDFAIYPDSQNPKHMIVSFRELENMTTLARISATVEGEGFFQSMASSTARAGFSARLETQFRRESRMFYLEKRDRIIKVKVHDRLTNRTSAESTGDCVLK